MTTILKASVIAVTLFFVLSACERNNGQQMDNNNRIKFLLKELHDPGSDYVMVAAHRGDWFWAPENSLKGFQNCIDAGVDILEIDVRLSKEGVPMVIHDVTLDRTTTGKGLVKNWTLDSLKTLYLKDAVGTVTTERIPTLEEVMDQAKGNILIYIDKSHDKVKRILPVLEKTETLHQSIFVSKFPYDRAASEFGDFLDQVIYVPVVEDKLPGVEQYLERHMEQADFPAYQLRIQRRESFSFQAMDRIKKQEARLFVAATWAHHTMGHDDEVSRVDPDKGWGWLIKQGFSILETNRPYELINYLKAQGIRK